MLVHNQLEEWGWDFKLMGDHRDKINVTFKGKKYVIKNYLGNFENDKPHGYGEGIIGKGKFIGNWKDGVPHGQVKIYEKDILVYDGEFLEFQPHGRGEYLVSGRTTYKGEYRYGKKHGIGQAFKNGELIYSGEWKEGQRHGVGKEYNSNKLLYDGEWKNNLRDGKGIEFVSAISYEGDRFLQPIEIDEILPLYEGEWKEGLKHGIGRYNYWLIPWCPWSKKNEPIIEFYYLGNWLFGKKEGNGILKKNLILQLAQDPL